MKKLLFLLILPLIISILVFATLVFFTTRSEGKGALQVTSLPKSEVFLDNKRIGVTPICKCELPEMLETGEYTIRLVPVPENATQSEFVPFEEKIKIKKSVLTVVDRTFGKGGGNEGSIITLVPLEDKKAVEILVLSFPEKSDVMLDANQVGTTPLYLKNITESDHEIKLTKSGYKEKEIRIRTVPGYKLEALVFLGVVDVLISSNSASLATDSAQITSSSANQSSQSSSLINQKVTILQTPTGFLRVREEGSLNASEIARVYPGEEYDLIEEKDNWYEIKLVDGKKGWISTQYAKKK